MTAPMSNRQRHGFAFDAFILIEQDYSLQRDGEPVALAPKAFEMLLVLVRHAGQALSKDELMAEVWPDAFVEEANLAVHISMLRKALGERPDGGQYIETLPRRGYRFAAEVRPVAEDPAAAPPPMDSAASPTAAALAVPPVLPAASGDGQPAAPSALVFFGRHKAALALALVVAAALAALAYFLSPRKSPAPRTGAIHKLAVLPFVNKGPAGGSYDVGFALADSVINRLGAIRALIVVPTPYVAKYANTDVNPEQVAQELEVGFLLTGRYLIDGEDMTVDAQLIDVEHNKTLWGESISVKSDRIIELQDYVAQKVVKGLPVQLSAKEDARLSQSLSIDPRAYANFARSRYLMSTNNHREAIKLLDEAVEIDPNFALGWTYLARAYHINALQFSGDQKELSAAESAYEQALTLDPEEPQARLMYAKLLTETGRVEASAPRLIALLADQPNQGEAHWELSYAYRYAGLLDESIAEGERARELDPRLQSHQFNSYLYSGQYEKFLNSLPIQESAYVTFYRGLAYLYLNDLQRAAAQFDRAYELNSASVIPQIGKAIRLGMAGKKAEGLALLQKVEAKITQAGFGDGEIAYKFAQAYAAVGDDRAALLALNRSIAQGFFCHPYIAGDPMLKNLRGPEFDALIEKARQRHEAFRRRIAEVTASSPPR